jgi:hypothetical protein
MKDPLRECLFDSVTIHIVPIKKEMIPATHIEEIELLVSLLTQLDNEDAGEEL